MEPPVTNTSTAPPTIMDRLRDATADAHKQAEQRPLMRAIARGSVTPELYRSHLEQLLLVHRSLEGALAHAAAAGQAGWEALALGERRREADLEADLRVHGGNLAPAALPATAAAVAEIQSASPAALLGMLYVTEGSTNGGRFLVKKVAQGLGLEPSVREGLRALDPYGAEQPARWAAFKGAINALPLTPEAGDAMERGATRMFQLLGAVADQVAPAA